MLSTGTRAAFIKNNNHASYGKRKKRVYYEKAR